MMATATRVSRQDAAARLKVSESTLDRMIRRGELTTEKELHGTKHRVWVLLEEDHDQSAVVAAVDGADKSEYSPEVYADKGEHSRRNGAYSTGEDLTALQVEVERWRDLAEYRGELLKDSEWRYHELLQQLTKSQENTERLASTLQRALPDSAGEPSAPRRWAWWPFRRS